MKKIIMILLSVCLIFSLAACNVDDILPNDSESGDGSQSAAEAKDILLFGGEEDYKIVYSSDASTAVKEMIVDIEQDVKKATGTTPKRVADNSKKEDEIAKEILIATTNRAESSQGMDKISGVSYRVEFIGEKLVLTASNDAMLQKAVEALRGAWTVSDGKVTLSSTTLLTEDMTSQMMPICQNGAFRFKLIIQSSAEQQVHQKADELAARLSSLTGKVVNVSYDTMVAGSDGDYEICIGNTNRAISQSLYGTLATSLEYKIKTEGNKIAVGAKDTSALREALNILIEELCTAISSTYCGDPAIAKDYKVNGSMAATLENFPEPEAGTYRGTYIVGDESERILYYEDVTEADYTSYIAGLSEAGCTTVNTYTMGGNKYTLMDNEEYRVYVAYLSKIGNMRIILDKPDDIQPEPAAPTAGNVCTPALWQLKLDTKAAGANGGMSYVIQLTDGSFVVVDGGYRSDAKALYEHLKANTVGNGKPVISAWIITHLHNDHYGALKGITSSYKDMVEVKAFYYNFPGVQCEDVGAGNTKDVENVMRQWAGVKMYSKLHSGMTFSVVDAKFTVICTYEDVYPLTIENGNDTSTVLKAEVGGQSIMLLADAYYKESATMVSQIDASVLKSDIVQISHHGYEGCSESLYKTVNAHTALWPMPIVGYSNNNVFNTWYNKGFNSYIKNSTSIKKIIISGAGTEKLVLPYTPTGDRIINFNSYYNENKE